MRSPWLITCLLLPFVIPVFVLTAETRAQESAVSASPTPTHEASSESKETKQSTSPIGSKLFEILRGDILVFAATFLVFAATVALVICTGALVKATRQLNVTTREHVQHSRELVKTAQSILSIDRIARLAVSVVKGNDNKPVICIQNIGRVPAMIDEMSLKFSGPGVPANKYVVEQVRNTWLTPSNLQTVGDQHLSKMWFNHAITTVAVECTFYDVYEKEKYRAESRWEFDHGAETIMHQPVEA